MKESEINAIQRFIDYLYDNFNGELTGPHTDWMLAKTDFKKFAAGYLAEFIRQED